MSFFETRRSGEQPGLYVFFQQLFLLYLRKEKRQPFQIVLLVLVSGEYFKALRALDAARRERLAATTRGSASENV